MGRVNHWARESPPREPRIVPDATQQAGRGKATLTGTISTLEATIEQKDAALAEHTRTQDAL
jgi:hypothetical protein